MAVNIAPIGVLHPVPGVRLACAAASIKAHRNPNPAAAERSDLVVLALAAGTTVAGVFTQSHFRAAPVLLCQQALADAHTPISALVINSGNANAATGDLGLANARTVCAAVGAELVAEGAVLPFSTGVIGEHLPVERMCLALDGLSNSLGEDRWLSAAKAIMTTDTVPKALSRQLDFNGTTITITGMAKGSGMICPDMATMLSFIACDAPVAGPLLQQLCGRIADRSFNRVTVDGDTSTNDSFVLLATGVAAIPAIERDDDPRAAMLESALTEVAVDLAQRIARDGEGATRFVTINVQGGASAADCLAVARTLAHSPLLKTAIFAGDPNWGRLCMAIGRAPAMVNAEQVDLWLASAAGRICVAREGMVASDYVEERASAIMAEAELEIDVTLGSSAHAETLWTCDFSYDYVKINAEYRT